MGLLDRLKTNRPGDDAAGVRPPASFDDLQAAHDDDRTVAMAISRKADLDLPTVAQPVATLAPGQSIISELPPSDQLSDFSESRLMQPPGSAPARPRPAVVLPWIGDQPVATQQRILGAVVLLGLLLLVLATVLALASASRNAVQVGATGQALMQSQRLAKAVSQALVAIRPPSSS
jgi:twitching motility protein PilJ